MADYFKDVTLLITHYNRSISLGRLLCAFENMNCQFAEIIVSDDGSESKHIALLHQLKGKYKFNLLTTPKNKGLGNNINKGQEAVRTPFTLYIQEDFIPKESFACHFKEALCIMMEDASVDMITLYAYSLYPYLKPYKGRFLEKVFHWEPWYSDNLKFYLYGDHPHLRKSSFLEDFGRYSENLNSDNTEFQMSLSFINKGGKCLIYEDHYGLLTQDNPQEEPSTAKFRRPNTVGNSFLYKCARWVYGKIKFVRLNYKLWTARRTL